jgi:ribosome-associated heat shock protein Hsp15
VIVQALEGQRKDAVTARALYTETAESARERARAIAARRLARAGLIAPALRPDKHERRELRRLKQSVPGD